MLVGTSIISSIASIVLATFEVSLLPPSSDYLYAASVAMLLKEQSFPGLVKEFVSFWPKFFSHFAIALLLTTVTVVLKNSFHANTASNIECNSYKPFK